MAQSSALSGRMNKARRKARFVGFLYLIATIFVAVMAFFPMVYGTSVGTMSVLNFWKPFLQIGDIKTSVVPIGVNIFVSGLYALLLLSVVINVIRIFVKCSSLYARARDKGGCDTTVFLKRDAMERMGKIFSGTYCVFIVFLFMIHLIAGAGFTRLFFVTLLVGLIIHFWAGLVGANVSRFVRMDDEKDFKGLSKNQQKQHLDEYEFEEQPKYGRIAPFFRNLAQLIFVGLIMYFISKTNLMMNALHWLEKDAFKNLFSQAKMNLFQYGGLPLLQLFTCIWTVVLLKHATASTEFDSKGKEAKGRLNFRIFSILIVVTAGALFGLMWFASVRRAYIMPTMGTLYIAVIALAAVIEEFCMCRLPNLRGKEDDGGKDDKDKDNKGKDDKDKDDKDKDGKDKDGKDKDGKDKDGKDKDGKDKDGKDKDDGKLQLQFQPPQPWDIPVNFTFSNSQQLQGKSDDDDSDKDDYDSYTDEDWASLYEFLFK